MIPSNSNGSYPPQFNPYLNYMNQGGAYPPSEMFNMYMQQMGSAATWQMAPKNNESLDQTMASDEGSRDSGNDTVSPSLLAHASYYSQPTSAAVSPHYPDPQQQNIQNPNPYAIHNLIGTTTPSTPEEDNKENVAKTADASRSSMPSAPYPLYNPLMFMHPSMYTKDLCVVCGDSATGHHYGVLSCEGCKGFFRRSVNKGLKYTCQKGVNCQFSYQACQANRGIRTRCQACRYKRCIEVGMNKANVRVTQPIPSQQVGGASDIPAEVKTIISAYCSVCPDSVKFTNPVQAIDLVKQFIDAAGLDSGAVDTNKVSSGLMWLRVAYSFDEVSFFTTPSRASNIEKLRSGIRNSGFSNEEMALIFALFVLQSLKKNSGTELYKSICECLQRQFTVSHPNEPRVYEVVFFNLFLVADF